MHKQYKDLLRAVVTALRHRLAGTWDEAGVPIRGDLDRELERLGFAPDGAITPIDALVQPTDEERRAYQAADARIAPFAAGAARCLARAEFVERAAYTWINRLLALRTMEARELIDETLRPNDAYNGISEALYLLRHSAPARTQGPDAGWQAVLDDACAAFAPTLPGLFDPADPNAALRPAATALLDCIRILGGRLPAATYAVAEVDAAFRDPDALGWAYQFYQQEAKDRVYAKLGSGGKIETRSEIAAATQLFTEPYMVKWMLQNSLGRTYHETYPASKLPATWEYYIRSEERDGRGDNPQSPIFQSPISLSSLTLLDPSMGSGHILREGFDMLFAMYREQHPALEPAEIARRILAEHLYGIDIDPRAAQLAALTLLLRAWETVRLHHSQFTIHHSQFVLNLATTPILAPGALARHLDHHPADAIYRPILAGVFAALEQAHLLGSLLRPEEHLDAAIAEFRRQSGRGGGQMGLLGESTAANRLLEELGKSDPAELKRLLLARVGRSFAREAAAGDVGSRLLGREAGEGVHLLQLLDKRYSVVCTNPPYMGSTNMDAPTKRYVEQHYKAGKRDLYAAFILRCLDLCKHAGRVAMITQQSWMFLTSFADLRAVPEDVLAKTKQKGEFTGLLRETTIEGLAHLGSSAFEEIEGVVVSNSMFSIVKIPCAFNHKLFSLRLTGLDTPAKKDSAIVLALTQPILEIVFRTSQVDLLRVENTPITYWLGPSTRRFLDRLQLGESTRIVQQVITADNSRFLRYSWETSIPIDRWWRYVKGGGYRKWAGLENMRIEWDDEGIRLKESITAKYPYLNGNWSWLVKAESLGLPSLTYTLMAQGSLGVRRVRENTLCDSASPTIVFRELIPGIALWLNTRTISFLLRSLSNDVKFREGYVGKSPILSVYPSDIVSIEKSLIQGKAEFISGDIIEDEFLGVLSEKTSLLASALIAFLEGYGEAKSVELQNISAAELRQIYGEVGTPVGWYPLINGYDMMPNPPTGLNFLPLPQELIGAHAIHERIASDPSEFARIKANLRMLYEAGPGAKGVDLDLEELDHQDDDEASAAGAFIPIPTETFLEELSVKLEIHPISVYWLLEELRGEGVRCKPEERRLLEDRLSVLVLRLLGHRWPKQIEAGEPVPDWADADGVIPLTPHTGEATLVDRVRARLRAEEGDLGVQRSEALLQELTGRTLAEWLRRDFFKRHVSQFKKRPVAWHLASRPGRGAKRAGGEPAFECMVYYHRTDTDLLARMRTQYVERLLEREHGAVVNARRGGAPDETAIAIASERIRELEEFAGRLRQVEEQGFACPALDDLLAAEPLDRWSGDGVVPPPSRAALLVQEQAWRVDINDGVRVNVAPLQTAGLLASDVLAAKELPKAIAGRARWRADERRWVRAGKLPRCGWLEEDVPESPAWTTLAPEREKERVRLAEKRRKVMEEIRE